MTDHPLLQRLKDLDKVRFLIVDEDNEARSSTWFITCEFGSLYLAPRSLGSDMKLSLHPKGRSKDGHDSQFGLERRARERQREVGFSPPTPMRWTRPSPPAVGTLHVASILFPSELLTERMGKPVEDEKLKFAFPLPPPGHVIELGLFTHLQHPDELEEAFIRAGGMPISYHDLADGEFCSLVVRQTVIDPWRQFFTKPENGTMRPLSGMPAAGEVVQGRCLLIGDVPKQGGAFVMAESGPVSIRG